MRGEDSFWKTVIGIDDLSYYLRHSSGGARRENLSP